MPIETRAVAFAPNAPMRSGEAMRSVVVFGA
jgi:hypothetical protein